MHKVVFYWGLWGEIKLVNSCLDVCALATLVANVWLNDFCIFRVIEREASKKQSVHSTFHVPDGTLPAIFYLIHISYLEIIPSLMPNAFLQLRTFWLALAKLNACD